MSVPSFKLGDEGTLEVKSGADQLVGRLSGAGGLADPENLAKSPEEALQPILMARSIFVIRHDLIS